MSHPIHLILSPGTRIVARQAKPAPNDSTLFAIKCGERPWPDVSVGAETPLK